MNNELEEIIEKLNFRLSQYKSTENYKNHPLNRQNVRMIEVAVLLVEMGYENKRKILESEIHWFEGCYLLSYDFGGQWHDIGDLYCNMVDKVKEINYFHGVSKE